MENLPHGNYFIWHFMQALPSFAVNQLKKLTEAIFFFNFLGLTVNLFAPYRRLTLESKGSGNAVNRFVDRISFNIISRAIGAVVRTLIIIGGFAFFLILAAYYLLTIPVFAVFIPLSLPAYLKLKNGYVSESDIASPDNFAGKLHQNSLFKTISLFFDDQFQMIFAKIHLDYLNVKPQTPITVALHTIAKNYPKLQVFLEKDHVRVQDFEILIKTVDNLLNPPARSRIIPLGETLSYGYTNTLDRYSVELTSLKQPAAHINLELLKKIEKILLRPQDNNVLLIGEPGVGRHTTLNMLSSAIQNHQLTMLNNKRLKLLDTVSLSGGNKNLVEIKNNLQYIIEEAAHAGNIILAVDQIDKIVSSQEGRVDLSEVLISHLKSQVPIIGIATQDDYNQFVRTNPSLIKLFEKIDIPEATDDQTLAILIEKSLEEYHKDGIVSYLSSLLEIIRESNKLLAERKQPEKSIIFFNDIIGEAKSQKNKLVSTDTVEKVLTSLSPIPVGKIGGNESKTLKNLEDLLHKRIIGQDEAIIEIARAMRRSRTGIEIGTRPIGSFLFLGPTGVGKTETAKVLAQTYFGDANNMVRLDMSEFRDNDAIKKLSGDAPSKTPGILTSQIREHPFSILLLDEFEKANSAAHNLFLQILDEGFMTDATGKRVNFNNNIIIATSNAGAEFIREEIENSSAAKNEQLTAKLMAHVMQKGFFSPELINRFDATVVYKPLTQNQVTQVTTLMLKDLNSKLKETKNISIEITEELAQKVAAAGFDPQFGARPIRRLIQDKIEDAIAKMIIDGNVKNGDTIPADQLFPR